MFEEVWEHLKENIFNMVTSRLLVLLVVIFGLGSYLIYTIFQLQIVNGEEYANNFQLKITKKRTIESTRGNIYARNGELLAYNELAYSVTIEDVYESGSKKNANLNNTIYQLIQMIERNGDSIINDFNIVLDSNNNYQFNLEGTQLLRFLADIYGHAYIDDPDFQEKEKSATPDEVMEYLCGTSRYGIGNYTDESDRSSFQPGLGYTKEEVLKILTIRYAMSANSYQKYIATTVANNVSEKTVAVVMENADVLDGVSIAEGTIRKYNDSIYFAQILGYTGKVSGDELKALQEKNLDYDLNDTVGKSGIEASMETILQGTKGSETVYVDNVGKVIETKDRIEPVAGKDIWLTIDPELQIAAYHILEEKIAGILLAKIQNIKEFTPPEGSTNIMIPIYDVYFALFDNNVFDTAHFSSKFAGETESIVWESYQEKKAKVFEKLETELTETCTPYNMLTKEYQVYESFIVSMLYDNNVIMRSEVDREDKTYIAWTTEEVISLNEYLNYVIAKNWVDVSKLDIVSQYSDSQEIYDKIISYIFKKLDTNPDFEKKIYRYMINNDELTGRQICSLLLEQNIVSVEQDEQDRFERGTISPYTFMRNRIEHLDITPAQLALEPYSGSIVITDVNTGDVLALVSYPSYDNNKMANGVDADYFAKLRTDLSRPMLNYATQQRTAPGSTFKMVSATAGLMENVIGTTDTITCTGIYDKITQPPRCWIAGSTGSGAHGSLNVTGGIQHSCNWFFYEVGYRLGIVGNSYNSDVGLNMLAKYADMYGLSETSGVELEEYEPEISDLDSVRSAIGQGTNNFTTAGLARYVTTVANSGTCYNLTLIDKIMDHSGDVVEENHAGVRNQIDMDDAYWNAIHLGMRRVVEGKSYYSDLGVNVAGKTGTAQESTSHPNHALFVSYAPYEDPEISVVVRVANGYASDYAAQIGREVYKYYYGLAEESEIITGSAGALEGGSINGD